MSYPESYFTTRESWRDWRIEANELIRLANVTPGARILEIGCGGGGLLRLLRARGAMVIGVDTQESALFLAQRRDETCRRGNAASACGCLLLSSWVRIAEDGALPFHNASFDAIVGQHVIEHLPDIDAALREWHRLLKPNGRLALATPNARYPDPAHFADADHVHIFTPNELRRALENAGFVVEICATIFPFLSRARFLRAFGVIMYRLFQHAPYFASRGRTILLRARLS